MKKFCVTAYVDEDVFDELCSYPDSRVTIVDSHDNEREIAVAKEIWKIAGMSQEYGNTLMDLLGTETYNKIMYIAKQE